MIKSGYNTEEWRNWFMEMVMSNILLIGAIVLIILVLAVAVSCIKIVPQAHAMKIGRAHV